MSRNAYFGMMLSFNAGMLWRDFGHKAMYADLTFIGIWGVVWLLFASSKPLFKSKDAAAKESQS